MEHNVFGLGEVAEHKSKIEKLIVLNGMGTPFVTCVISQKLH